MFSIPTLEIIRFINFHTCERQLFPSFTVLLPLVDIVVGIYQGQKSKVWQRGKGIFHELPNNDPTATTKTWSDLLLFQLCYHLKNNGSAF